MFISAYTKASNKSNDDKTLQWQLRCHKNMDRKNFSSLYNTA